jgi:Transposon-encoded protein TnpV
VQVSQNAAEAQYAREHRRFLEQHRPDVLASLRQQNNLDSYLSSIGEQARDRLGSLMAEHMNSAEVQKLPHLDRVRSLQNRRMEVEELIRDELINQPLKD